MTTAPTTVVATKSNSKYLNKTVMDFLLPELPEPAVPAVTSDGDKSTHDTYRILREVRRQLEEPGSEGRIRAMLREDPDVARAMYSVLLESRKILADGAAGGGAATGGAVIEPGALQPPPTLPVGQRSWLLPKD